MLATGPGHSIGARGTRTRTVTAAPSLRLLRSLGNSPSVRSITSNAHAVEPRREAARCPTCAAQAPGRQGAQTQLQTKAASASTSAAKSAFLATWLAAAVACYKLLSDHEGQLPVLPELPVASLAWALGGALCSAAASLALAKALLGEKLHLEWHRGWLYIQAGVPSSGPAMPAGAVQVLPTSDGRGNGAFATLPIPSGSFVCEYGGDLLNREQFYARYPDGVSDFCTGLDEEWAIDSCHLVTQTEVFHAVHMNHSRLRYNVLRYFDRGSRRISFFAARDIQPGEELLYDYGRNYWRGREHMELP